jgi:hypothetical protein
LNFLREAGGYQPSHIKEALELAVLARPLY